MLSEKRINKIMKDSKEMFDDLENFDKTRKLRTKKTVTFTIDRKIAKRFRETCKAKGFNMSQKIELFMRRVK